MIQALLIDDDERLASLLTQYFTSYDIQLSACTHPMQGIKQIKQNHYDIIILDIMLPEFDGFETCKRIRHFSAIPIIMLTARGDVMDRVVGLEIGADDYLAKPFEPRELTARIHNILKRTQGSSHHQDILKFDDLEIDMSRREVQLGGHIIELSSMEYQLLQLLVKQPGKIFSRDEILNALKGIGAEIFSRSIDILISRLRQKLKPSQFIKTVRGQGYCFAGKSQ
ncbi:MAG: response regulator transcription factor [Gammaproteobacteria bacterium]|nr:response regulator transcription factor [Gammaproteobacteria bacterium]